MRANHLLMVGVAGIGAMAGTAQAQYTFQTVLDDNQATPIAGVGAGPYYPGNFVVGNNGTMAAMLFPNDGGVYLVYGSPSQPMTLVATGGQDEGTWSGNTASGYTFTTPDTMSMSGNNTLTFGIPIDNNGDTGHGIYQYTNSPVPQSSRIIRSSGSAAALDPTNTSPLDISTTHQVNASGQVGISAFTNDGSTFSPEYAVRGTTAGNVMVAKAPESYADSFGGQDPRAKAITSDGTLVFTASDANGSKILQGDSGGIVTPRLESGGGTYSPSVVLAANATRTLFEDFNNGIVLQSKGTGWTTGDGATFTTLSSSGQAEMTDGGKVAIADNDPITNAGRITYVDSAASLSQIEVAHEGMTIANPNAPDPNGTGDWTITYIDQSFSPSVNESGYVAFMAEIVQSSSDEGDGSGTDRQALLVWSSSTQQLSVVLQTGQDVGDGRTAYGFGLTYGTGSAWTDALADDGTLGIGVAYSLAEDAEPGLHSALLVAQVPEPMTTVLMCFGAAGMLWRRPRRT